MEKDTLLKTFKACALNYYFGYFLCGLVTEIFRCNIVYMYCMTYSADQSLPVNIVSMLKIISFTEIFVEMTFVNVRGGGPWGQIPRSSRVW